MTERILTCASPPANPMRIPVTVLTGYLGAGKTTLLNRILSAPQGRRTAVIVNELGEIGIDAELIVAVGEELFELSNGCVCCTVRGDLIRTLHGLLSRPGTFDAIVVETTGLADPGPVAHTFFIDPLLATRTQLDSVTTVVDARHIGLRLADSREAAEQIAFADQIVLNKIELVAVDELPGIEARLRALNPLAPIHRASRADVPLDLILGRGGFDLERIGKLELEAIYPTGPGHGEPNLVEPNLVEAGHVHDEHCGHEPGRGHVHDSGITSISLSARQPMDRERIEAWLTRLFAEQGADILRAKGIIDVAGEDRRLVFQAVHMLLDADFQRPWTSSDARSSRLVFIGRNLDRAALEADFEACAFVRS